MGNEQNPWKILDHKTVYDNAWIDVTEFQVLNPSGGKGIYGKVHFKHLAIGVIPLDASFHIYLVGQYRFPLEQFSWEIPEGGGGAEEEPLAAAKRELLEETGLVASQWTRLLTMHLSNSVSDELAILFLARDLEQHTSMPDETESLTVRRIPFDEAVSMVESGVITDSMSVAAIQRVQIMLLQEKLKNN